MQVALPAHDRLTVGVDLERCGRGLFVQVEERLVLGALALGDNHRALGLHLVGVEEGVGQAVGFDADGEVEVLAGERLEVGGEVYPGKAVPAATVGLDEVAMSPFLRVGVPLKSMCSAQWEMPVMPGALVASAHPIPDVKADDGRVADLPSEYL